MRRLTPDFSEAEAARYMHEVVNRCAHSLRTRIYDYNSISTKFHSLLNSFGIFFSINLSMIRQSFLHCYAFNPVLLCFDNYREIICFVEKEKNDSSRCICVIRNSFSCEYSLLQKQEYI